MIRSRIALALLSGLVMASCSPQPAKEAEAPAPVAEPQVAACEVTVTSAALSAPAHGATFTAAVNNPAEGLTYNWSTTAGAITNGQGTAAITVEAPVGEFVTITVEVGGLPADCQPFGSATLEIS